MTVSIDLSEVHHLAADLLTRSVDIEPDVEDAIALVGYEIGGTAQSIAPVDTGHLKSNIVVDPDGLTVTITSRAAYSKWVEEGTSRMSAQPYMRPAFDQHVDELPEAMAQLGARIH